MRGRGRGRGKRKKGEGEGEGQEGEGEGEDTGRTGGIKQEEKELAYSVSGEGGKHQGV